MGFADSYLDKHRLYGDFIDGTPHKDLKYVVVIPCYDEDGITRVLDSMWEAERPEGAVEVMVVINASDADGPDVHSRNRQTLEEIGRWSQKHQEEADNYDRGTDIGFRFHIER